LNPGVYVLNQERPKPIVIARDRRYAGAASGLGAVYEWSGNSRAGSGRMEIVDAVDDDRVVIDSATLSRSGQRPTPSGESPDRRRQPP